MFASKETYAFHPLAQSFRMMNEDEFELLCEDMKAHGQRETIKLVKEDGKDLILDGRNRYKAGRQLKIECQYEYVADDTNLKEYVESLNAHRRHLSKAERDESIISLRKQGESIPTIAKKTQQSFGKVHATIKKEEEKRGKPLTTTVKAGKDKAGKPKTQKATNVPKPKPPNVNMTDATEIAAQPSDKGTAERPKIADLVGIVHRALGAAEEADQLSLKSNAVFFKVNGYRIRVTCKIV